MLNHIIKKILREATSDSGGSRGSYIAPMRPGLREFNKSQLNPFNIPVSKYDSPLLGFDSYDGKMSETKKQIKKIESKAEKSTRYLKNHPIQNDDDGDNINPTPGKGKKMVPIKEDLAVWFGKKKKPKGSKQPKGPWVDICRKVNGKHPPCGRSDADTGSYPKCRAAGVAGKMSDSAKRAACQQKRRAEKQDTQSGKGQKPVMTSYKPRKKTNENMKTIRLTESELVKIIKKIINEEDEIPGKKDKNRRFFETPINRTTITNNNGATVNILYDGVIYGYDRFKRKIAQLASKQKGLAGVLLVCDTGKFETDYNAHKEPIMSGEISPELYPVQDAYDKKILQPFCQQINWKYKDIYKKVRKKDPHIYGN